MNIGGTMSTALLRAFYSAVIVGLIAGLTATQQGLSDRDSIIAGLLAGLTVLATRGGVEGAFDAKRNAAGAVKPSDVTPN